MDDKMIELQEKMEQKLDAAKAAEGVEAKESLLDEYDALKKEFDAEKRLVDAEKDHISESVLEEIEHEKAEKREKDAVAAFAKAARQGFRVKAEGNLNETTPADGGYTVPEDIVTRIYHLRDAEFNLRQLVDVRKVRTLSGERTYRKRAQHTGFGAVSEGGKIPATGKPQFDRIRYMIEKYGGFMPVTNELFADTDANIVAEVVDWFSQESRVTGNKLVLTTADENTNAPVALGSLDDIKKVVNVILGQAFAPTSKIITNDDGSQILETLKDKNGNYLLKRENNDTADPYLSVGFRKIPLRFIPNSDLASDATNGVPFYIGDLKEGIKFFDRKLLSLESSRVAAIGEVNAWEQDLIIWRGIEREDCVLFDEAAFRKCYWSNNNAG